MVPLGNEERCLLERLMPHMQRSLRLGFRIDGYRALQRAEYWVMDRLSSRRLADPIKTHLCKVFEKTGARRQAERALLIASIGLVRPDTVKDTP